MVEICRDAPQTILKTFYNRQSPPPKKHVFDNSPALLFRLFVVGPSTRGICQYLYNRVLVSQSVGRLSQPVRQGAGLVPF